MQRNYKKDFFKSWSSDMAYVLGFLYADGNIIKTKRGTHFISFYSKDKDLLAGMQKVLGSDHSLSQRSIRSGKVYRIQIGSKVWFEDLLDLGLTVGKSARMKLPCIEGRYWPHFLRGYFDGDGNVWSGRIHQQRVRSTPTLQVSFTSASENFLLGLRERLQQSGVRGGSCFKLSSAQCYRLTFSVSDALKIAGIMYNAPHKLYLPRKKRVFDTFCKNK